MIWYAAGSIIIWTVVSHWFYIEKLNSNGHGPWYVQVFIAPVYACAYVYVFCYERMR